MSSDRSPLERSAERASAEDDEHAGAVVLIVEDDPRGARLLAAHVRSADYGVEVAHSADEARAVLARVTPDVILCDICMPGVDGIEFTRQVRANPLSADIPIALITSSDDSQVLARGLQAGADDFLSKPVNALELRTRVRSLLRSKRLMEELQRSKPAVTQADPDVPPRPEMPTQRNTPLIAIIEDVSHDRRLLEAHLGELHIETCAADSAAAGLALVHERQPDLVILDLLLPDCTGYELIASIKHDPACRGVPIMVVSGMAELADRVKALEMGADDFIIKGFDRLEFEARTRRLLRFKQSLDQLNSRCDEAMRQAVTDSLTGLYTRGFMDENLQRQLQLADQQGCPYSAIFGDIDHFKSINDNYGHAAGDRVLQQVADCLRKTLRNDDSLVRYGGEEFVALLPNTSAADAMLAAERMRASVASFPFPLLDGGTLRVTISLGVATYPDDATDGASLVQRGDAAMYLAKRSGRNRVVGFIDGANRGIHDRKVVDTLIASLAGDQAAACGQAPVSAHP